MMANRCQGLHTGASCPDNRCDASVKYSFYDVFLCPSCEKARDIDAADKTNKKGAGKLMKKSAKNQLVLPSLSAADRSCDISQDGNDVDNSGSSVDKGRHLTSDETRSTVTECLKDRSKNSEVNPVAEETACAASDFIVDELLTYVGFYRNRSTLDAIRRTVLSFYSSSDISQSKRTLVGKFSSQLATSVFVAERRNSSTRTAFEAELDDILNIGIVRFELDGTRHVLGRAISVVCDDKQLLLAALRHRPLFWEHFDPSHGRVGIFAVGHPLQDPATH
jgi:hypothetical protein